MSAQNSESVVSPEYSPYVAPSVGEFPLPLALRTAGMATGYVPGGSPSAAPPPAPSGGGIEFGYQGSPPAAQLAILPKLTLQGVSRSSGDLKEKWLIVTLADSDFKPGKDGLLCDTNSCRQWYTESIRVEMSFPDDKGKDAEQRIALVSDGPQTTSQSGSKSVSNSVDFQAGFFGETITGSVSSSFSTSVSVSLEDFEVRDLSDKKEHICVHEYRLALADGTDYKDPTSLLPQGFGEQMAALFASGGAALRTLPPRATSSFPIISQALFRARESYKKDPATGAPTTEIQRIPDAANLQIHVICTVAGILVDNQGSASNKVKFENSVKVPIPFAHII